MMDVDAMLDAQVQCAQARSIEQAVRAQTWCYSMWELLMACGEDAEAMCAMRWYGIFSGMAYAMAVCPRK